MSLVTYHVLRVGWYVSQITCYMSIVTFPLSPTLTATITDLPLDISPIMCHKIQLLYLLWSFTVFKKEVSFIKNSNHIGKTLEFYVNQPPKGKSQQDLDVSICNNQSFNIELVFVFPYPDKNRLRIYFWPHLLAGWHSKIKC